jgi:hypothetical protein
MLLLNVGSWLAHTAWIDPLASIVTGVATVGTLAAAVYIGQKAGSVAAQQKEIAGLAEVTAISEKLANPRYLASRKGLATAFNNGTNDESSASDLLDFMEEISIYESNGYIGIDTLCALYSGPFICWWYAAQGTVDPVRQRTMDPTLWCGTQRLINRMHAELRKAAPAWSSRPSDEVMKAVFANELKLVATALTPPQ